MPKKLCSFIIIYCIGFAAFSIYAAQVVVLNTCDLHGHLKERYRGFLKVATLIKQQKKLYPANSVLLIDCGDTTQGTYSSMFYQGSLMIDCMNYLGYDVWIPGNHDFDYGLPLLKKRVKQFKGASLIANLDYPGFRKICKGWKLFKKGDVSIAIIGMTVPDMGKSLLVPGWKFNTGCFEDGMKKVMPEVRAAKPDIIILAMHRGMYGHGGFSIHKFATRYPEIDLIMGAHTHRKESGRKIGPGTWYFQAGKHAEGLGRIIINFDKKSGKIRKISSSIIPVNHNTPDCPKLARIFDPELEGAAQNSRKLITTISFEGTKGMDSGFIEQRITGQMMLKLTGADVALCNTYPTRYKLSGKVPITLKRIFYWARYHDTICTLTLDRKTYQQILAEQKKLLKKNYRTIITYANKKAFASQTRIKAAFSSYAIVGAGGRFPKLREIAKNKANMLNNTGIVIRDGLCKFMKNYPKTVKAKAVETQSY